MFQQINFMLDLKNNKRKKCLELMQFSEYLLFFCFETNKWLIYHRQTSNKSTTDITSGYLLSMTASDSSVPHDSIGADLFGGWFGEAVIIGIPRYANDTNLAN